MTAGERRVDNDLVTDLESGYSLSYSVYDTGAISATDEWEV
jgi:hypothetical protein